MEKTNENKKIYCDFSGFEKVTVYIEKQLAPTLRKGDVVICDNLNVHKNKKAREMIEARATYRKCETVFG